MNVDDARAYVEILALLGGVIVSFVGSLYQIRVRRAADAVLVDKAGADVVSREKILHDIVALDPTYLEKVQSMINRLEAERDAARAQTPPVRESPPPWRPQ